MFLNGLIDFWGNYYFGEVLCFRLFLIFLCYGWTLYGFSDILVLHSSAIVHGFLDSWWFRGFLQG